MDEQGIYCPQCRAYVHFWTVPSGGRGAAFGLTPGVPIQMPEACKQCGHQGMYKTSDLRTRRVPTEPVRAAMLMPEARTAGTIDVQKIIDGKKFPERP
jgi:hypothetical protein